MAHTGRKIGGGIPGSGRFSFSIAVLFSAIVLLASGCTSSLVDTIQLSPTSQTLVTGQTVQFTATGLIGHGSHPATNEDVTTQVTWASSSPSVATINAGGLATGIAAGSTTITASLSGYGGVVSATATVTVTNSSGGSGGSPTTSITALSLIPATQTVATPGQTAQFIAIGTSSTGATVNLSSQVNWISSSSQIATIGASTGLATAVGQGTSTITALYTSNGSTLTASATFTVVAGTTEQFTALTIIPGSQSVSASGQTGQFVALATSGTTGFQEDVTSSPQIKWSSSIPTVATISSSGLATGASQGSSTITAELTNSDSTIVTANASVTVTLTAPPEPLLSLTIIPSTLSVGNLQDTGQFLAIGTFSTAPYVQDLTNSVTWLSSFPSVFPVNTNGTGVANPGIPAGVVTAYGNGSATIIAEATDPTTGSIQTATATFNCPLVLPNPNGNPPTPGSCFPGSQAAALLATLTIYNEGSNTTGWLVTAPSATGTQDVLHCGPGSSAAGYGGSVCVATYPVGATVILTAPKETGVNFGGWTSNCSNASDVEAGPNTCTVTLTTNDTVGAIFN